MIFAPRKYKFASLYLMGSSRCPWCSDPSQYARMIFVHSANLLLLGSVDRYPCPGKVSGQYFELPSKVLLLLQHSSITSLKVLPVQYPPPSRKMRILSVSVPWWTQRAGGVPSRHLASGSVVCTILWQRESEVAMVRRRRAKMAYLRVGIDIEVQIWLLHHVCNSLKRMEGVGERFRDLKYQAGFGNGFESEVLEGAIPKTQNSPVVLKHGVFAEQLSGTAFTVKRSENQKVWLYKMRPSVIQGQYAPTERGERILPQYINHQNLAYHPNQLRWKPIINVPEGKSVNFVDGLISVCGAGEPSLKQGIAVYNYSANTSMGKEAMVNSDGDFLIVPNTGTLYITTLMGKLIVSPKEICIIPRGIKFTIDVEGPIKGWVAELWGHHLGLPELGPIGANGLANPKDFLYPQAWFQDKQEEWTIVNKYIGKMFEAKSPYSPYDVVGWRGNYAPCKYNLQLYNTIGSISFDHPDPSIFTVLTARSAMEGTAALDFVVFPPRWLVAENTFKPPYYHRNCMSEYMGNICGEYDAKGKGFSPGCSSLHSAMTPHGPDAEAYEKFVTSQQKPYKISEGNYSFMFESGYLLKTTKWALENLEVDEEYYKDWLRLANLRFEEK